MPNFEKLPCGKGYRSLVEIRFAAVLVFLFCTVSVLICNIGAHLHAISQDKKLDPNSGSPEFGSILPSPQPYNAERPSM